MTGLRIRERRLAAGLRQGELAERIGISPSYLNLIERNKRRASPDIVRRAAEALGAPLAELDGALERRLADRLAEIATEPDFADLALDPASARELLGRHPGWGRALARAWRARREADRAVEALSDRLTHDPFVSEAMHGMLTRIAALRSTSEILEQVEDIDDAQRRRFHGILAQESANLTEVAESLTQFFDRAHRDAETSSPAEDVEEAFLEAGNRFEALEDPAAPAQARPEAVDAALRAWAAGGDATAPGDAPDEGPGARRWARARAAAQARYGKVIDGLIAARPRLARDAAHRRARAAFEGYAADALLLPAPAITAAGLVAGWDVDALAARFEAPFAAVARRLASLGGGAPGAAAEAEDAAPRCAFVRVNAAGLALERRLLPEIALPRHGAACPLWAVYRALSSPGRTLRQLAEFPSGERFVFVARAEPVGPPRWGGMQPVEAALLALPAEAAMASVYAPRPREPAEPVGPNCRVCTRGDCRWRAEDPLTG
ncbi:MAG: short-chain fatty acyl-CoA regulator family protein [Pseudomonadota bacterium]